MHINLRPFIARAPWLADDIAAEADVAVREGLDYAGVFDRLWRLVRAEVVQRSIGFAPTELATVIRAKGSVRGGTRSLLTVGQRAKLERDLAIQVAHAAGLSQRLLASVHGLPRSVIGEICLQDLRAKLAKMQRVALDGPRRSGDL